MQKKKVIKITIPFNTYLKYKNFLFYKKQKCYIFLSKLQVWNFVSTSSKVALVYVFHNSHQSITQILISSNFLSLIQNSFFFFFVAKKIENKEIPKEKWEENYEFLLFG